jgi:hypothetical protein
MWNSCVQAAEVWQGGQLWVVNVFSYTIHAQTVDNHASLLLFPSFPPLTVTFPKLSVILRSLYFLVSCHTRRFWSEWEVSEGNDNLVYPSPWDFKSSFTYRKILRHGTSGFSSHSKECVLRICIALKNRLPWPGSNQQTLGPLASTLTTTSPSRRPIT